MRIAQVWDIGTNRRGWSSTKDTGVISGTPSGAGAFTPAVTATDKKLSSNTASTTFSFTVCEQVAIDPIAEQKVYVNEGRLGHGDREGEAATRSPSARPRDRSGLRSMQPPASSAEVRTMRIPTRLR